MSGMQDTTEKNISEHQKNSNEAIVKKEFPNGFRNPTRFPLEDLYRYALKFYKEKSGKAVHISYEERNRLVALSHQVNHGPFNEETAETLGVFDVVGKDRRIAWQALGAMSKEEARINFIDLLHSLSQTFVPYLEAVWADYLEKQRLLKEEEEKKLIDEEEKIKLEESNKKELVEVKKQEATKRQIQEALNAQTFDQFKSYAEQQYPGNPEQQGVLVKQLQEQHYMQYMQQVYQQQIVLQQNQDSADDDKEIHDEVSESQDEDTQKEDEEYDDRSGCEDGGIPPASMWTRRDIKEFKESIRQEGGDSVIKVGHGETVTVRVPTHVDGNSLFWEFATDSYDIGFGVLFEWTNDPSNVVSIHITESDEDEPNDEDDEDNELEDIERMAGLKSSPKPSQSVIIPVYRRDCHEEVYAGSHLYPGKGEYLLKFDNTYSLWRSKVLYYRVYYTQ